LLAPTLDPWEAKALGRQVKNYTDQVWTKVRYTRMLEVNREKYKNSRYRKLLLDTGDKLIVECNPKDPVWGIGLSETDPATLDQSQWKGQNLLGEVLMQIRKELKKSI